MSPRRRLMPPDDELAALVNAGVTPEEIADTYGSSRSTVYAALARAGLSARGGTREPVVPQPTETIRFVGDGWMPPYALDGLCGEVGPELFFPAPSDSRTAQTAKAVCQPCPVRDECLEWAIEHREPHGIWGGKTPRQRQRIRTARRRATATEGATA